MKEESSLDSDDAVKRRRAPSIDSDDLDMKDSIFLTKQIGQMPNRKIEELIKEESAKAEKTRK